MNSMFPVVINLLLAAIVGYLLGGVVGAGVGAMLMLVLNALVALVRQQLARAATRPVGGRSVGREVGNLLLKALAIPFGLFGAAVTTGAAVAMFVLSPVTGPLGCVGREIAATPGRIVRFIANLFSPNLLPWTLGNALLLIVIGVVTVGIDVAFYVALTAVPLLILVLAKLAITGGEEPDEEAFNESH